MWLDRIAQDYIHQVLEGLGKLAAISDSYPNLRAMAADGSRQEWSACFLCETAYAASS